MARVWYASLTGKTPPAPPTAGKPAHGPGTLGAKNLFTPALAVTVSNTFPGSVFARKNLVDGTNKAFVFGDGKSERVSLSGFPVTAALHRLRFFDTPSYTGRTPGQVTLFAAGG